MPRIRSTNSSNQLLWKFAQGWLGAGLIILLVAFGFALYTSQWLLRSDSTQGTIVAMTPKASTQAEDGISYAPVFTFPAKNGQTYTVSSNVGSNSPGFTIGQRVNVRYLRNNPTSAKINTFIQTWFMPAIFTGFGIFFTTAGYILRLYTKRKSARSLSV